MLMPGNPVSRDQREQDRATYDRLLLVFRAVDPGVDEENLHFSLRTTMAYLAGSLGEGGYSVSFLAERHGFDNEAKYIRYVEYTEGILRRRMQAHGVWRNKEFCDCGCGVEQQEVRA